MEIKINIPDYDKNNGFVSNWEDGFEIKVESKNNCVEIIANAEGLISLATQFLNLAQEFFPPGYHLHYDSYNSLEDGSTELIIQKI